MSTGRDESNLGNETKRNTQVRGVSGLCMTEKNKILIELRTQFKNILTNIAQPDVMSLQG